MGGWGFGHDTGERGGGAGFCDGKGELILCGRHCALGRFEHETVPHNVASSLDIYIGKRR